MGSLALLVRLGPRQRDYRPFPREVAILAVQPDQLRLAEHTHEAHKQQGAVAYAERAIRYGGQHCSLGLSDVGVGSVASRQRPANAYADEQKAVFRTPNLHHGLCPRDLRAARVGSD